MTVRKTDRRTLITKEMIKDALLTLLQHTRYEKITITALCKQAEITRTTFYLHYDNLDDVLDELLDEALRLSELEHFDTSQTSYSACSINNDTASAKSQADSDAFLPVCQRAASNPKYKLLFLDESLSHHILNKIFIFQKKNRIPNIMKDYCVDEREAELLLLFMLHGNFAVNKALKWEKNQEWYQMQSIISKLLKP